MTTYRDSGYHICRACRLAVVPGGVAFCGPCRPYVAEELAGRAAEREEALALLIDDPGPPESIRKGPPGGVAPPGAAPHTTAGPDE